MRIDRHTAAVVDYGQPVADVERDLDPRRVARNGFVHTVVDDFRCKMMQRTLVGAANVHAGTATDGFEPFQHLDLGGVVAFGSGGGAVEQIVTHGLAIGGREGRWQARFSGDPGRGADRFPAARLVPFSAQAGTSPKAGGLIG